MSRIEESDKVRRSIERGDPQPTYISQRQKDALQVLTDQTQRYSNVRRNRTK